MNRKTIVMLLLIAAVAAAAFLILRPAKADYVLSDVISSAIADPGRAGDRAADERRKPAPLIALSGVKPGDHVLDLIPGSGYWTRIFSKIVGPEGRVHAVWPASYGKLARGDVAKLREMSASPAYSNVVTSIQPTTVLTSPEPLDLVWTSQNYHDYPDEFMAKTDPGVLNRAVFAMLKPGGVYMVIDHRAAAGRGMADTESLHRIEPATVKAQVEAAGFKFEGASEVLLNPSDPLNIAVFEPAVRGRTSQFAYKFRKPAS